MIEPSVLVVDDEVQFVETLAKRLTKRGVKVSAAHSGQEALDALEGGGATRTDVVDHIQGQGLFGGARPEPDHDGIGFHRASTVARHIAARASRSSGTVIAARPRHRVSVISFSRALSSSKLKVRSRFN